MKAYKVVTVLSNGWLVSFEADGKASVIYKLNKWVSAPSWLKRKGYHLFIFRDLEKAVDLVACADSKYIHEIYECEAKGIIEKLPPFLSVDGICHGIIEPFVQSFPKGTLMAKKVKLLKRVWP